MTDAVDLRPTRAGTVKFALFYASFIAIPIAITFFLLEGLSPELFAGLALGYVVAAAFFFLLVSSGFYGLTPTDAGLRSGRGRSRLLPWSEIDRIETGRFLGQEIWVRVLGRPQPPKQGPVLAVVPAFLFGMSAPELRDYLRIRLSQGTGSRT